MILLRKENIVEQVIPDNSDAGLVNGITFIKKGTITNASVTVDIAHSFIGDLSVDLVSPDGKKHSLLARNGRQGKNLKETFSIEAANGSSISGEWKLVCKDFAPADQGKLISWAIEATCEEHTTDSEIFIPEEDSMSLNSIQVCKHKGTLKSLKVDVDVEHPFVGDLVVKLIAPSGKTVVLHDRAGGNNDNLVKTYTGEDVAAMIGESVEGNWTLSVADFAPRDSGVLRAWKLWMNIFDKDNLTKIEGIGPKIEELLNSAGISTFAGLAATSPEAIKEVLVEGGPKFKMHDPSSWPRQSHLAAVGSWDELQVLQDELDGGK